MFKDEMVLRRVKYSLERSKIYFFFIYIEREIFIIYIIDSIFGPVTPFRYENIGTT